MNPPKHKQTKYDDDDDDDGKPAALTATTTTTTTTDMAADHSTVQDVTTAAMDVVEQEPTHSSTDSINKGFIYVALDGNMSQITKIQVSHGEDIDDIKAAIKEKGKPAFDTIAVFAMQLFTYKKRSEASNDGNLLEAAGEPLNSLEKWNPGVTWGTKKQPLIVYTPKNLVGGESISYSK